jgi:hypothetical protein
MQELVAPSHNVRAFFDTKMQILQQKEKENKSCMKKEVHFRFDIDFDAAGEVTSIYKLQQRARESNKKKSARVTYKSASVPYRTAARTNRSE